MLVADFSFDLPDHLIARYPLPNRTSSRLLVLDKQNGRLSHKQFTDLLDFINPDDLLIFNNTKVLAARLLGTKLTGGKVEILIERITDEYQALAHIKSSKSPKIGAILHVGDIPITVLERQQDLYQIVANIPILQLLEKYGHIPLPPYLQRGDEDLDISRYQTVYAEKLGAVAAPTAGLHFDNDLLERIMQKGIQTAAVTLHVGAGTFQPVRSQRIEDHQMHYEWCDVSGAVVEQVNACKKRGGRVFAIGTTSARALESAVIDGNLRRFCGETDIFFYPGSKQKLQIVDVLLTNFHLPQSTLIMLVSAFAGWDKIQQAYKVAIEHEYRFFSYGDAMLIGDNLCNLTY